MDVLQSHHIGNFISLISSKFPISDAFFLLLNGFFTAFHSQLTVADQVKE
jgi:hypothetical protein